MIELRKNFRKFLMWLLIPKGCYCYDDIGLCPFFSKICGLEGSANCSYVDEISDFNRGILLDDQCKICGEKLWNDKE